MILKTRHLTKRFGGLTAVDEVDFSVLEGEIRCIIGPNGAGKSTFSQLVCGTHKSDSGTILFNEKDVSRLPAFRRVRLGLGLKFQTNRAYHNLTVSQNLGIPLREWQWARNPSAEGYFRLATESFQLEDKGHLPAKQLPHHQLQWLEICVALASGPRLLFLDEPTAGMSPEETHFTAEVVKKLNQMGLTIVAVEHDMTFVREIAQTVTVLHQGRVFAEGTMSEISAHDGVKQIYLGSA
ncbi:MAG: ABC transporter ATP-binding protein [Deltaproteobacteria bacterium]|nr:ABC transporter ATP-binding protein [Deltaproteobacteria bacterium]